MTAAVVGHKRAAHVQANLEVGTTPIMARREWEELVSHLQEV